MFIVSGITVSVTECYTPQGAGRGECILPYAYPVQVRPSGAGLNRRGYFLLSEEWVQAQREPRIRRQDEQGNSGRRF